MTKSTAQIGEVCRKAISGDAHYLSNDIPQLRHVAVENVKNVIICKHKTNAIMAEWLQAKEEQKRGSLRK
jgi:hypothetical protein